MTPLILKTFSESELAVWYLFSSVSFFGVITSQRFGLTFSRMFAFAMGGESDLSPKAKISLERSDAIVPAWESFSRAYGSLGVVSLIAAVSSFIASALFGWVAMRNLIGERTDLWLAFFVFLISGSVSILYRRYSAALQGMNYVALEARWNLIFNIISVGVGIVVLALGGQVLALTIGMQLVVLIAPIRQRFLLSRVEGGRVLTFKPYRFDKEAFRWSWAPTYKGFLGEMGLMGSMQVTSALYANMGSKREVASYLFATRMVDIIVGMGQVPYTSMQPRLSRMFAAGQAKEVSALVRERFRFSWIITASGFVGAAFFFPLFLGSFGSKTDFVPIQVWFTFGFIALLSRFVALNMSISSIGNAVPFYKEMIISCAFSLLGALYFVDKWPYFGAYCSATLPMLILVNVRALAKGASILGLRWGRWALADFLVVLGVYLAVSAAALTLTK